MNISHQAKWLTLLTLLINAAAMLSPVINGGDSITYATLSQHIALTNDWANLVLDGKDWLDKPHMPFWITALFFKIGGVSAFTYILPGFLLHLIGGYSPTASRACSMAATPHGCRCWCMCRCTT